MSIKKEHIVVTGGTGFVGAHLLFHLSKLHENITAIKRIDSSTRITEKIFSWYQKDSKQLYNKINWVEGDVIDIETLRTVFIKATHVYHSAGVVSFDPKEKENLMAINAEGTENVVNAALEAGVNKLCYVSSVAAIGRDGDSNKLDEETPWNKNKYISTYALSKHQGERAVWRGIAEGLNAVIVNPSIILGPGNWDSGSLKLFQTVSSGLKFYTQGKNGYVDVRDLVEIMIQLMNSNISGERFIVNGENMSYENLFKKMAKALHVPPPKKRAGKWMSEIIWRILFVKSLITGQQPLITKETARTANSSYEYSHDKIKQALKFEFRSISETIKYTAEIYRKEIEQFKSQGRQRQ